MEVPRIAGPARKRGFSDADILHAFHNAVRIVEGRNEMALHIGPDHSGRMLEIGVVETDEGPVILHAMPYPRPKKG